MKQSRSYEDYTKNHQYESKDEKKYTVYIFISSTDAQRLIIISTDTYFTHENAALLKTKAMIHF